MVSESLIMALFSWTFPSPMFLFGPFDHSNMATSSSSCFAIISPNHPKYYYYTDFFRPALRTDYNVSSPSPMAGRSQVMPAWASARSREHFYNLISVVCFGIGSFPSYFRPVVLELWDGGLKMWGHGSGGEDRQMKIIALAIWVFAI